MPNSRLLAKVTDPSGNVTRGSEADELQSLRVEWMLSTSPEVKNLMQRFRSIAFFIPDESR